MFVYKSIKDAENYVSHLLCSCDATHAFGDVILALVRLVLELTTIKFYYFVFCIILFSVSFSCKFCSIAKLKQLKIH